MEHWRLLFFGLRPQLHADGRRGRLAVIAGCDGFNIYLFFSIHKLHRTRLYCALVIQEHRSYGFRQNNEPYVNVLVTIIYTYNYSTPVDDEQQRSVTKSSFYEFRNRLHCRKTNTEISLF